MAGFQGVVRRFKKLSSRGPKTPRRRDCATLGATYRKCTDFALYTSSEFERDISRRPRTIVTGNLTQKSGPCLMKRSRLGMTNSYVGGGGVQRAVVRWQRRKRRKKSFQRDALIAPIRKGLKSETLILRFFLDNSWADRGAVRRVSRGRRQVVSELIFVRRVKRIFLAPTKVEKSNAASIPDAPLSRLPFFENQAAKNKSGKEAFWGRRDTQIYRSMKWPRARCAGSKYARPGDRPENLGRPTRGPLSGSR